MRTDIQKVQFLDLTAQNAPLRPEIESRWTEILDDNSFILGPAVSSFEERFAEFCEAPFAMTVDSGTSRCS